MKKRFLWMMASIILCFSFLTGCQKKEEQEISKENGIYYLNTERTDLVYQSYEPDEKNPVGVLLKDLQAQPKESDICSAFLDGVEIVGYELDDTDLFIHFNKAFRKLSSTEKLLLKAVIVKSAVSLKDVDYVAFYVGAKPLKDESGKEIGLVNEDYFVEGIGSTLHALNEEEVAMYLPDSSFQYLKVKYTIIKYSNDTLKEKAIAEALLPKDTKLLNVTEADNTCYLNYDEGLIPGTTGINPKVQIYSIVNSIVENTDVMRVQFLVNGEAIDRDLDNVELTKPLTHNLDLIKGE